MGRKVNPIGFRLGVNKTWDATITKFNIDTRLTAAFGDFPLGYADTICILLGILFLAFFGPFNASMGIIICGFIIGLIQGLYSVFTYNVSPTLIGLSFLIILLGLLLAEISRPEEHV